MIPYKLGIVLCVILLLSDTLSAQNKVFGRKFPQLQNQGRPLSDSLVFDPEVNEPSMQERTIRFPLGYEVSVESIGTGEFAVVILTYISLNGKIETPKELQRVSESDRRVMIILNNGQKGSFKSNEYPDDDESNDKIIAGHFVDFTIQSAKILPNAKASIVDSPGGFELGKISRKYNSLGQLYSVSFHEFSNKSHILISWKKGTSGN